MKKKDIVIIGGGGHAKVIIDAILQSRSFAIKGIIDPNIPKGSEIFGIKVLGGDFLLKDIYASGVRQAFIGIGSVGDYGPRRRSFLALQKMGFLLPVIRHPFSSIAGDVQVGKGTFIAAGAVINTGTVIGGNVIINTSSSIDHDCVIGDFSHIAPGAILCGRVKIGREVHIGAGAVVVQNRQIADRAFIKAAGLVSKDIKD